MRTVVDLDEEALAKAMELTGLRKKVEVVNLALRELVVQREREQILGLAGEVAWGETEGSARTSPATEEGDRGPHR